MEALVFKHFSLLLLQVQGHIITVILLKPNLRTLRLGRTKFENQKDSKSRQNSSLQPKKALHWPSQATRPCSLSPSLVAPWWRPAHFENRKISKSIFANLPVFEAMAWVVTQPKLSNQLLAKLKEGVGRQLPLFAKLSVN